MIVIARSEATKQSRAVRANGPGLLRSAHNDGCWLRCLAIVLSVLSVASAQAETARSGTIGLVITSWYTAMHETKDGKEVLAFAIRQCVSLVFASSAAVYGLSGPGHFTPTLENLR